MTPKPKEVDKVEVLTLQDNYVDGAAFDSSEIVQRAIPIKDQEIKNSSLAEHGFSALVTVTTHGRARNILFDFGFSEHGAAYNADALEVDLSAVEAMVLSHGHMDHFGGFHLTGADFEPIIEPTTEALKALNPQYVVATHCTGRKAVMHIESEMPDKFLLNMSGTKMIFAA